ncbi:MAG: ABC transporter ATP-binding protein [Variovorax paradoxus]|nr:MAG: ABC transporter ATP-binding protein [Variovorax paradoxus]PZQ04177.1 MAG: ABC transporter ATP-binding protein [Variovorax paradoxus]
MPDKTSPLILEARKLSKEFKGFLAVDAVDLGVRRGTIHALIGPNGAGKTTMFNLLTRFVSPTRGSIRFNDQDITTLRPDVVARRGLVRSFQISAVFPHLTVLDNVRVALQNKLGNSYRFWRSESSLRSLNARAVDLLEQVDLASHAGAVAADLSYGRKRALELATTLAMDPELLLLDEPTSGMGHEDVGRVIALIRKVAVNRTVLMVEHNLRMVADLSDTITVLQRGSVLAEGSYDELSRDARVRSAYMGTKA